jgi:hypothetical protein
MNLCWIIPRNAPPCRRDVQPSDKKELQDGGYAEFRLAVDEGDDQRQGSVYVQERPNGVTSTDWAKAARGLFSAERFQVFRLDGSPLL